MRPASVAALVALFGALTLAQGGQPGQTQVFRTGVDVVSLNVTVIDGAGRYVTDLRQRIRGLRGRREAGSDVLHPHQPADRAVAAGGHQRQHGGQAVTAQEAAIGFARNPAFAGSGVGIDFDSRVEILQGFTSTPRRSSAPSARRRPAVPRRCYNALYISLKELKKMRAARRRHPPPGHRGAFRRRGHVEPGQLRGGARSRQAVRDGHLHHRPERAKSALTAASRRRSSCSPARAGDRRPLFLPRGGSGAARASTGRLPTSCRASTRSATRPKNARRDGAWRRLVVQVEPAQRHGPGQAGLLRAERRRRDGEGRQAREPDWVYTLRAVAPST